MDENSFIPAELRIEADIPDPKWAGGEIGAWRDRYELLIAAFGQLVHEYDLSTGEMIWGPCLDQIWGYSQGEMRGGIAQWEERIHPEDREKVLRILKISEKYLTPFDAQYRFRHKDGTYRWVHDRGDFTTDGRGKAVRMVGMVQDITTHRRAEKELQESEARYHSLFKKNQAAMLMIDPETTTIIDANLGACVFYGYPYEKILKLSMADIDTLTAEEVKAGMQRALSEKQNHCYCRHRLATGQIRDVEVYSGPLFMRGKQLVYSIIHDITERKQAEEALRQSEEKYRTILESIEEGYCEVDLAGNFTFFNDSMSRIFGYPKEELMGMNNRQYTDRENAKKLFQAFSQVYRTGEPHRGYEYEIIRKDGTKRYVETSVSLRKDASGHPTGFRGIARDITERKRAEEELAYRATHDLLTGLPNRMLFKDRFNMAIVQAQQTHKKLAVIFLDLDRFKEVNDTLGHDAGDELLYAVGNRLIDLVRKTDTVARMGGDEFLLLLPNIVRAEDAINITRIVLDVLGQPFFLVGHEVSISTSIGVAIYPDDGLDIDTLVNRADKAMYEAKQRGHHTYSYFPRTVTSET
jgi:diguanylate cyclase (GGDEF)-like protein/PAS domain S-box-containing protein